MWCFLSHLSPSLNTLLPIQTATNKGHMRVFHNSLFQDACSGNLQPNQATMLQFLCMNQSFNFYACTFKSDIIGLGQIYLKTFTNYFKFLANHLLFVLKSQHAATHYVNDGDQQSQQSHHRKGIDIVDALITLSPFARMCFKGNKTSHILLAFTSSPLDLCLASP